MNLICAVLALLAQEDSRRYCDGMKAKLAGAPVPEKVRLVRELGNAEWRDGVVAAALGRQLMPAANDPGFVVPSAAAEALGRFRGSAAAAKAVAAALPAYRKHPSIHARLVEALGRIGHEAGAAALEELAGGIDVDDAAAAVRAIADYPAPEALEILFRRLEELEKKKTSISDEAKPGLERLQAEVMGAIQRLSGEKYPTSSELRLWWKKRGEAFRAEALRREQARPAPPPAGGALPSVLLVELRFKENMGNRTANTGVAGGEAAIAGAKWRGPAPVSAGPAALEWDASGGAADLACADALRGLKSFTISGWILAGDAADGRRVVSWLHPAKSGEGVELVRRSDGSLQLGVNQPAEASAARGPSGKIPLVTEGDGWRFFAVTYDGAKVRYYSGSAQADAALDAEVALARGAAGAKVAPGLTVGNGAAPAKSADRAFRGAIDELRIFGSPYDGSGALELPAIRKLQNRPPG